MIDLLDVIEDINIKTFVHINRENYNKFYKILSGENTNYFGLDVKDIIDELFPWERFIKEETLICLQSKENEKREENFEYAQKMLKYSYTGNLAITIDRSVELATISKIRDSTNINIVSGSYLKKDNLQNYKLLKSYFYERR
jgi:hypothetical protein